MSFLPALLLQAPAAAPAAGTANPMVFFIQIGVIFLIFYFIVMRPQRKQQKLLEQAILSLSKGDEVTTSGGLIGEVIHTGATLKDGNPVSSLADRVTIRTGESKVVVERGRIVRVTKAGEA
jgi:preprotein translocase subunit YajC